MKLTQQQIEDTKTKTWILEEAVKEYPFEVIENLVAQYLTGNRNTTMMVSLEEAGWN